MESTIVGLDKFLGSQIEYGSCSSIEEAKETLIVALLDMDFQNRVKRGRANYQNGAGHHRTMTKNSNDQFTARLEQKYKNNKAQ